MEATTAVVLAAGEGTRLRPLTRNRPKPMLPAANRPILEYVLDALVEAGVDRICLVVGYKRDRVQGHFGPTYRDVPLVYAHQRKQLGSGHALLQARSVCDGPVLVVNGDRLLDASAVREVSETFERHGEPTLAVLEHPETSQYGAVRLRDGYLDELVEKPDADEFRFINAGIYAFDADIFDAVEATPRREGELGLTDTVVRFLAAGEPVRGVQIGGLWADATYPWDLLAVADELFARGRIGEREVAERVWVAESARVHDEATLQAPVVVGPDCEVAAGAVVGPNVALGRNATVGPNVTLVRSVLDADTRVEAGSVLIDAVAGEDCHLGASTTVPGGPADVRVDDRIFSRQRLGAVFADRVRAEGDVSCAPGTLVGPEARLGVGVRASGTVEAGAEVRR
ncbi:MAG: sugar phosphate nucleotidyltransferase [Haloarculaceae archaeon]